MPAIFHFTDVTNLGRILAAGELRAHRTAGCAVDIGDASIKVRRTRINVACGLGGQVCDYVPFYFATRSPMLFSIKCGNVQGVSSDQRRIIYLTSSTEAAYDAGLACVFTDGNASAAFTDFEDDPAKLATLIDWQLMRERYWRNTAEDNDRRRRRAAEFLIHNAMPLRRITGIGVYNECVRAHVAAAIDAAGSHISVDILPDWYF